MHEDLKPTIYHLFQDTAAGRAVLEHLSARFYDSPLYEKGDPYHSAFLLGQREVVKYILNCMLSAQLKPSSQPEDE